MLERGVGQCSPVGAVQHGITVVGLSDRQARLGPLDAHVLAGVGVPRPRAVEMQYPPVGRPDERASGFSTNTSRSDSAIIRS